MLRVHRIPHSTNVERVALAAGHKGIDVEWVDHDHADRSAVIELSGQELVPVAEIDGEVIRGSMRIVERIEREHPDPPLVPADPARAARARILVAWFDRVWKGPPNALDADPEPADAAALRTRARSWTPLFEDLLADEPFLSGAAFGLEDVCAFPFLKYMVLDMPPDDDYRFHRILVHLLGDGDHPRIREWIARVDELPRA